MPNEKNSINGWTDCSFFIEKYILFCFSTNQYGENFDTNFERVRMGSRSNGAASFVGAIACVQFYNAFMSYNEISKVSTLCNPERKPHFQVFIIYSGSKCQFSISAWVKVIRSCSCVMLACIEGHIRCVLNGSLICSKRVLWSNILQ